MVCVATGCKVDGWTAVTITEKDIATTKNTAESNKAYDSYLITMNTIFTLMVSAKLGTKNLISATCLRISAAVPMRRSYEIDIKISTNQLKTELKISFHQKWCKKRRVPSLWREDTISIKSNLKVLEKANNEKAQSVRFCKNFSHR